MKKIEVDGRCACQRVRFTLREEPIAYYLCHCTDCQAESGSAFGQTMLVRSEALTAPSGPSRQHTGEGLDGRRTIMTYCENCMTGLVSYNAEIPNVSGVNAGAFDGRLGLTPYGNMWTKSALAWSTFAPGPRFDGQPPDPLEMIRVWQARPR
jgi:hypothetical protein